MSEKRDHSRRDFLRGRAAASALADKLQVWVQQRLNAASAVIADRLPPDPVWHERATRRAMACQFEVQYHREDTGAVDAVLEALDLIEQIEAQLTIYRPESETITINREAANRPVRVDVTLFALLQLAERLHRETGGAFDITSTPLSRIWGFLKRQGRLPETSEINAARALVDGSQVVLDPQQQTVRFLRPGVEINFNSIGKGFALDQAGKFLASWGVADFLMHGGSSSVLARGRNRAEQRDGWSVGLRHPLRPESYLAWLHLQDRALGTAGGATQYFEHEGRRFSHVIDPRTGWPAEGLHSARVLAPTAAEADALATAFYVIGVEGAAQFCLNRPEIAAVLVATSPPPADTVVYALNLGPADWTPAENLDLRTDPLS